MDELLSFDSPEILIEAAGSEVSIFEKMACDFVENCTYEIVKKFHRKDRQTHLWAKFHQRISPELRVCAYRITSDLRNALDQAFCVSACLLGRPNAKNLYFPCAKNDRDFAEKIKGKCKDVDPELIHIVTNIDSVYRETLYELNHLSGPNKHQSMIGVGLDTRGFIIPGDQPKGFIKGPCIFGLREWNDKRNELLLARLGEGCQVQVEFGLVYEIAITAAGGLLGHPAAAAFRRLHEEVRSVVLSLKQEVLELVSARASLLSARASAQNSR